MTSTHDPHDDLGNVIMIDHICIRDPDSGEIILKKRAVQPSQPFKEAKDGD